ncbi:MAG TPA: type II secretion system protein GspM [Desulfuromonadaceae bacterium]|nr:type II secretion system protein GspM [Desulfuromonadaceae bacterium]
MNKLSKEKRDQILMIVLGTATVLALIWFFLISPQRAASQAILKTMGAKQHQLQEMEDTIKKADAAASTLGGIAASLNDAESDMVSTDPNVWIYDLIRHFKEHYKVDISVGGQTSTGDSNLIPNFPYRELRVTVNGTAFYHDLGEFISSFENTYPHIRVTGLSLEPTGGDTEKLNFHMDIIALIKPNAQS